MTKLKSQNSLAYRVRPRGNVPMKRLSGGESLVPDLEEGEEDTLIGAGLKEPWQLGTEGIMREAEVGGSQN